MAAAYAALVSLSHILQQILHPPPTHHFIFPRESVESLRNKVCSLIKFLERFPSRRIEEIKDVEARIVEVAHEAEDIIESDVVTQIQRQYAARHAPRSDHHHEIVLEALHGCITKVMEGFNSIEEDLPDMKDVEGQTSSPSSSSTSLPEGKKDIMVGFDEHFNQVKSRLASDDSSLVVIPIVGMGGMGKTTLAKNICKDPLIIEIFDRFAWVRVSQEYKEWDVVRALLQQVNSTIIDQVKDLSSDELGVLLHKELFGRRYLIVLDDVWYIEAWDKLKRYLPGNNTRSRILVTTRLQNLAGSSPHQMTLLDHEKSWDLIHEYVKEDCPSELEEIGRSIARGCGGLPLALVAIGGLLAKSEKTRGFWKHVEKNVTSIANYADGDEKKCIEILRMSYSELPVYLKPCFLYLAVFPKHSEIRVSRLIRLWVAEGFIKPCENKILEKVAREYLKDLLDRNLVMTSKLGHVGKVIKKCSIHDLMRDLCTKEAEKNKFLWFDHTNAEISENDQRRLCIHTSGSGKEFRPGLKNRSLLSYSAWESRRRVTRGPNLVRVLDVVDSYSVDEISWLTNSRYVACTIPRDLSVPCAVFVSLLWNLQTLALSGPVALPSEFWQMSQLRHLNIPGITLTDPDPGDVVLENLQTLATVRDFTFSQNAVKRIRNVNKLGIDCEASTGSFGLSNVASLEKLESLVLKWRGSWENMGFPKSLRKLTLSYCQIPWEKMSVVGSLPNLEALKLRKRAARGRKWSPNEDEFVRLKFLLIDWCQLEIWEADDSHFPMLEQLQLVGVRMEEFPQDFADIATLRTIHLSYCSDALLLSAKRMLEDREDDDITIRAFHFEASRSRKRNLVGLEDEVVKLKGYLLEESEKIDVISIVGMDGIGKTTLAGEIFRDPEIQYEFPTRIWLTGSQEFSERSMFLCMLKEFAAHSDDIYHKTDGELARLVFEFLRFAKFLLVVDDLWQIDDWNRLRSALPMTGKVLIASCNMDVCHYASYPREPYLMHYLSEEESWLLLCLELFGKPDQFPSNLEARGKLVAEKCQGLPLAVVLVGGILGKKLEESTNAEDALEKALIQVSENFFDSDFASELFENVFTMGYEKLPHHLRRCFFYVGMFPENYEIPAWKLIRLWIAEGFVQQEDNSISLEETAEKYLDDLISFNLLRVDELNASGKVKTIGMHGMLRYPCTHKANEEGGTFFHEIMKKRHGEAYNEPSHELKEYQRLCIHHDVIDFLSLNPVSPSVRSFLCFSKEYFVSVDPRYTSALAAGFKMLKVLDIMPLTVTVTEEKPDSKWKKRLKKIGWGRWRGSVPQRPPFLYEWLHLKYLALSLDSAFLPADFCEFRNIQTLIIHTTSPTLDVQVDILNMIELRHFKTNASAALLTPTATSEGGDNIQTLRMISPKSCTKQVFDRARNLKELGIRGKLALLLEDENRSFLIFGKLEDLEKLKLINDDDVYPLLTLPPAEIFPIKLRSLTLCRTAIDWSYMSVLGSLENLEVLKLKDNAFRGKSWEATDGGFPHLRFLHIGRTDLEIWEASHDHFPRLKHLVLRYCEDLEELPLGLAHVPNFQRLDLHRCSLAAVSSARKISEAKKTQENEQQYYSTNVRSFSLNVE